jgi:hypothetical protein
MRCPGCHGVFRFFVHGNGAVELRPVDDEPATESRLPPRVAEQGETQGTRTIFTSRRRHRPIGGYLPFEKSRSYIGTFALWAVLGLGSLAVYWYRTQIYTIVNAKGGKGISAMNQDLEVKRKDFDDVPAVVGRRGGPAELRGYPAAACWTRERSLAGSSRAALSIQRCS